MLIAEMLLLVAMNDKGHVPFGSDSFIKAGLSGALLAELAIDGRLTITEDGRVRAGSARPDDELLADVYDAVRTQLDGRKARQVISGLDRRIGGSWHRVVDRLVAAGVLGREKASGFWPTQHPVIDRATRQLVLDQVRAAVAGQGPMRADVSAVLALAGPCRLVERVAPDRHARAEARRRIAQATAETPFAPGVATIIDATTAAITASVIAAS